MDRATTASKGASTPPGSLSTVLNKLWMEEENLGCPLFLLSIEIFNYNVHNCFVDSGGAANIMPVSSAKKINAQWNKMSTRIIKLD